VLTVLVLDLGRVVGSDWLMHRVWGMTCHRQHATALHGHVTMLRRSSVRPANLK
jgi:DNA-binding winged helix-turn-helix (wHTH) protein